MSSIENHMSLKEKADAFKDLPAVKKFICSLCGFRFSQERYLTNHLNFCKNENPELRLGPGPIILQSEPSKEQGQSVELLDQWSTNEATFDIKIELDLDFMESVSDTSCPLSGQPVGISKPAEEPTQREEHINARERPDKPYKSNNCDFNTAQRKHLKLQKQTHTRKKSGKLGTGTGQKQFNCEICDYSSTRRSDLRLHMLKHTGDKRFNCEICDYSSTHRGNFKQHALKHTREKRFRCELCNFGANHRNHFQRHMLEHTGEKKYNCEMCDYSSTRRSACRRHMLKHTGEKLFNCEICDYASAYPGNFKRHALTHTGKNTFNCKICDYVSTGRYNFQQHMLKHTGGTTFKCETCKYVSKRRDNLQRHMLTHTGETTFRCEICEFVSKRHDSLQRHMLQHTGVNAQALQKHEQA